MSSSRAAYHHGDLAHALESAALQLLTERPAHQISLREVARAADVSHNAPYHHFADRQGLLRVLAERSMADLVDDVRGSFARTDDAVSALVDGGQAYLRFAITRPNAFDVIYDPAVCVPGSPTETMAELIAELEAALGAAVVSAGLAPADAPAIWGIAHGLGTLAAAGHLEPDTALASFETAIRRMTSR